MDQALWALNSVRNGKILSLQRFKFTCSFTVMSLYVLSAVVTFVNGSVHSKHGFTVSLLNKM